MAGRDARPTERSKMRRFVHNLFELLEMIKIGHSVLALPFAFMGAILAARGLPDGRTVFYILVAMVGARSAAMAFNRLVDARFDAANPRTADRALPAGKISRRATILFIMASAVIFIGAAAQLNRRCSCQPLRRQRYPWRNYPRVPRQPTWRTEPLRRKPAE